MFTTFTCAQGQVIRSITGRMEFLVDGASDLSGLPTSCSPGSVAYTATMEDMWQKDNAGAWRKIGGDA